MSSTCKTHPKFGRAFRSHFLFGDDYLPMNHGSFGAFPRSVQEAQCTYRLETECQPDQFIRYDALKHISVSRHSIAKFLNTSPDECVFVQNATLGLNTILRNLVPTFASRTARVDPVNNEKSCVVYFDTIYGAIEKTLFSIRENDPSIELRKVTSYTLPCSHEAIISALIDVLNKADQEGLRVKACVFETITSVPAARFPFQEITRICRERSIYSVIDGAHGVGQIPLDLGALDPDFFVSNCHKWLYTPRGCAVLYVPERNQHFIRTTLPTSWGFEALPDPPKQESMLPHTEDDIVLNEQQLATREKGSAYFTGLFSYVGTADNTAFYCVPAALDFRRRICGGEEAVYEYIQYIGQAGADLIAKSLGTEVMDLVSNEEPNQVVNGAGGTHLADIRQCAMANVLLPFAIKDTDGALSATISQPFAPPISQSSPTHSGIVPIPIELEDIAIHASWLTATIIKEYRIGVTVYPYASRIWLRVSGQIYLELSDFERLAGVLAVALERVRKGESLREKN